MVKRGRPVRSRVAGLARRWELRGFMIGVSRAVVIRSVTINTRCREAIVNTARVTLIARCLDMSSSQREAGVVVIVVRVPVVRSVTSLTLVRKTSSFVVRIVGTIVISQVTCNASRRQSVILSRRVTLNTTGLHVLAR